MFYRIYIGTQEKTMDYGKRAKIVIILCCLVLAINISFSKKAKPKEPYEERLYRQTKIAFQSYRDGNCEIYVMNVDGS